MYQHIEREISLYSKKELRNARIWNKILKNLSYKINNLSEYNYLYKKICSYITSRQFYV